MCIVVCSEDSRTSYEQVGARGCDKYVMTASRLIVPVRDVEMGWGGTDETVNHLVRRLRGFLTLNPPDCTRSEKVRVGTGGSNACQPPCSGEKASRP